MTKLYKYLMMAMAVFAVVSCSQEEDFATNEAAVKKNVQFVIGDYPGFADVTRAIGTADAGKTAWAAGDEIFVKVSGGTVATNQFITLAYDGTNWTATDSVVYITTTGMTINAIWAPGHQMAADGTISCKAGVKSGTTEYLQTVCSLDAATGTISVEFDTDSDRSYSRLRIVPRKDAASVTVVTTGFTPSDGGVAEPSYTLTPDAKGNAYLYGTWAANGTVEVSYNISGKGFAKKHEFTSSTVGNRSYALSAKPIGEIVDPAKTEKGDFAMIDGSFVSKDSILVMNQEQIEGCVGLVFWTESEAGTATLSSDKVLAKDFPECNHGLILSMVDLLKGQFWQMPSESVYETYQSTPLFTDPDKALYAPIMSGIAATDPIQTIQGYGNTKLIKQYNAYCEANGKADKVVVPVAALKTFAVSAPDNSSGWFIPSVKELTLLFGCDFEDVVEDVTDATGIINRDFIEDIFTQTSVTNVPFHTDLNYDFYWSTTEEDSGWAWLVYAKDGYVYDQRKSRELNVRAICAY